MNEWEKVENMEIRGEWSGKYKNRWKMQNVENVRKRKMC